MTAPGARRADRDRDPSGRARNARPRDASGRPLPPGEAGVERVDEDVVLAPQDALAEAQRLLDGGYPFHAHEVLEGAWKSGPDDERPFWKGLAQLAVGLTHAQRGNRRGAASLLRRGPPTPSPRGRPPGRAHGVDATRLAGWARARADAVAAGRSSARAGPRSCATDAVSAASRARAPDPRHRLSPLSQEALRHGERTLRQARRDPRGERRRAGRADPAAPDRRRRGRDDHAGLGRHRRDPGDEQRHQPGRHLHRRRRDHRRVGRRLRRA